MYDVRILVAEDEDALREMITKYIEREGYHVYQARDGKEAIELVDSQQFDLAILDVMMPFKNGWQVCKRINETSSTPVIFLTARTQEEDKVMGFELGADQYVEKPYSNKELVARVNGLLRKNKIGRTKNIIRIEDLYLDKDARQVMISNNEITLTPKEYDMLLYFIDNIDIVLSREILLDRIWGFESYVDERTVDTVVKRLRKKMGDIGTLIKTIRGIGYKFEV